MSSEALKLLTVNYPAGERIVAAGESGTCMFVVQDGQVRLLRRSDASARRTEIGVLERGDFFGEGALLEGRPYSMDAEAVSDCEIVEIGASTFHSMLQSHPEIAVRVMRKLAARIERLETTVSAGHAANGETKAPAEAPADETPQASPEPEEPSAPAATLEVEGCEESFKLAGAEMLIGRYDPVTEVQPEIDLSSVDSKRSVSRRHARIFIEEDAWHVREEVGTLNGTFVNGTRVQPGRHALLKEGDVITVGMVKLVFHG